MITGGDMNAFVTEAIEALVMGQRRDVNMVIVAGKIMSSEIDEGVHGSMRVASSDVMLTFYCKDVDLHRAAAASDTVTLFGKLENASGVPPHVVVSCWKIQT